MPSHTKSHLLLLWNLLWEFTIFVNFQRRKLPFGRLFFYYICTLRERDFIARFRTYALRERSTASRLRAMALSPFPNICPARTRFHSPPPSMRFPPSVGRRHDTVFPASKLFCEGQLIFLLGKRRYIRFQLRPCGLRDGILMNAAAHTL